jgi:hypothetical protein
LVLLGEVDGSFDNQKILFEEFFNPEGISPSTYVTENEGLGVGTHEL